MLLFITATKSNYPAPVLDLSSLIPQGSKTGTANYTSVDPQNPEEKISVSDAKITEL